MTIDMEIDDPKGRCSPGPYSARSRRLVRPSLLLGLTAAVLLALITLFFWPILHGTYTPRWYSRMSAARSYLLFELRPAQLGMKDERILDRDADGEGEFGTLEDLVRASEKVGAMKLWERPSEFRAELDEGRIAWGSYLLKVYVPKDVDEREQMWCAAVWPALYKRGGRYSLVYWVNPMFPAGKLARTEDSRYSGWGKGPRLDEIFEGEPFQSEVRRDVWETY